MRNPYQKPELGAQGLWANPFAISTQAADDKDVDAAQDGREVAGNDEEAQALPALPAIS